MSEDTMSEDTMSDKVWDREAVLDLINSSNLATGRALWGLYQRQTASEQATEQTRDRNGVGFNGRDAEFLSSVAKRLPAYGFTLTDRQLPHVRRKIRKYVRQLLEIIEEKGGKIDFKRQAPKLTEQPVSAVAKPAAEERAQFGLLHAYPLDTHRHNPQTQPLYSRRSGQSGSLTIGGSHDE